MKRLAILFIALLCAVRPSASAQEAAPAAQAAKSSEIPCHILFKQVPVDGSLEEFTSNLRAVGMSFLGIRDDEALMEGRFAGVDGAKVRAFASGGVTWKVVADLPAFENWTSVKKQYLFFKRSLASKYVVEPKSVERFPAYCPEGSAREHVAFREETATYTSEFSVPNGTVTLSVLPVTAGAGRLFLRMEYVDELNSMLRDSELFDDL